MENIKKAGLWLRTSIDSRDVLGAAGIALVSFGLGGSSGMIAAGVGVFYLGVLHPVLILLVARRD